MPATIEQRLSAVEGALSNLMEGGQESFVHVNPDGTISYDFAGHIHAQGLDLDEGSSATPPADNMIRWLDGGGVAREQIFGYFAFNQHFAKVNLPDSGASFAVSHDMGTGLDFFTIALNAVPSVFSIDNTQFQFRDPAGAASTTPLFVRGDGMYLDWVDGSLHFDDSVGAHKTILDTANVGGFPLARWGTNLAAHNAKLRAFSNGQNAVPADAYCDVSVDGVFRTLINRGAESAYPQLASTRRDSRVEVNFGVDTIATNAVNAATKNIAHGLANTPIAVFVICSNNNANVVCQSGAYGAVNFTAQVAHRDAATNFGAGTTQSIAWLAIG